MKDRRLVPALRLIHNEPARDWTVDMLAEPAHMSRPRFSAHFRSIIGMPPMDYLVRWRIRLVVQRLRDTDDPVKVIAASLGFKSPSLSQELSSGRKASRRGKAAQSPGNCYWQRSRARSAKLTARLPSPR